MSNTLPIEKSLMMPAAMLTYAGHLVSISEKLQVIEINIKIADEAVMFNWLGAAREYFFDASNCIQARINKTIITCNDTDEVIEISVENKINTDEDAASAAQ